MISHEVSIAALAAFAEALRAYPPRQAATLEAADRAIARAGAALADAEQRWRYEVERRRAEAAACLAEAAFAASQGMYLDCSAYERALYDAEEVLRRVVETRWRLEDVASSYRAAALRYGAVLEEGLPRGVTYLETCIEIYSAVAATPLRSHPALSTSLRGQASPVLESSTPPEATGPRSSSSPERSENVERREGGPEQRG